MSIKKAKLIVTLKADDTIVAEVEDSILWQKVLSAIHNPSIEFTSPAPVDGNKEKNISTTHSTNINSSNSPLAKFANRVGINENQLVGAIDPSTEPPFLHLDVSCWEQMKKQAPARGSGAVAAAALTGTLLCIWFKEIGLGNPTQAQIAAVLKQINVVDKNTPRSIKNSSWLQGRPGGMVVLNPAEVSKAYNIAKSFCTKKWGNSDNE
jgi:hypothetical protein